MGFGGIHIHFRIKFLVYANPNFSLMLGFVFLTPIFPYLSVILTR